jgi:type VI secretion system secreted protein Hcp
MAFDAFVKIDGIRGGSNDSTHKDWSEILSFSQGMFQPASSIASAGGGASTERANLSEFTVVKALDRASTKIYEFCCKGQHINTVVVELCQTGGARFLEIKMEDVVICGVTPTGDAMGTAVLPSETVSFNFARILWTYCETHEEGAVVGSVTGGWDLSRNTSWK